jgi:3-dehydroquinate dehydratase
MKQKTKKYNIPVDRQRHLWLSQNHTAMKLAMYELNQYAVDLLKHITEQAEIGGVAKEQTQEFIEWLLDSESFQDQIIVHASAFVETQKALEEALKKD